LPEINPSSFITADRNRTIWKINNGYNTVWIIYRACTELLKTDRLRPNALIKSVVKFKYKNPMDFSTIIVFLVIFLLIGMNFVLIINVASYKVFPLADAMTRGDNESTYW
jgi:hypothetical protein